MQQEIDAPSGVTLHQIQLWSAVIREHIKKGQLDAATKEIQELDAKWQAQAIYFAPVSAGLETSFLGPYAQFMGMMMENNAALTEALAAQGKPPAAQIDDTRGYLTIR